MEMGVLGMDSLRMIMTDDTQLFELKHSNQADLS